MGEVISRAAHKKAILDEARIASEIHGYDDRSDPFVAAVRATRMPMIITNPRLPDNPAIFINDAFCRMSGYAREEILGRNCRFLQGPESDPSAVARIKEAVQAKQAIHLDIRNHRKDGSTFWNRLLMAPVFDAKRDLAYFFASQVDVTLERERLAGLETDNAALMAELTDRLRVQEEHEREMAYAMRAGQFGTWSLEFASMELSASDTCKELFGHPPGRPFTYGDRFRSILPEDRALAESALARVVEEGADYDVTYRIMRPNGTIRWLSSRGQAFINADGRPLRMAGVSRDVTVEHRADRMRAALVELSDIFSKQDDPDQISFCVAQLIGQTLDVSRAGYGLIDREAETITIARDWNAPGIRSLAGTLRFRDFGSYIDDLKRGQTAVVTDARLDARTRDTAPALEAISARAFVNMPLTEQEGLVALLYLNHADAREWPEDELSFIHDVAERTREATERRRAEKALATLAASLETEVQERTRELMAVEEALRQSQKMEAVGQLTGGLAHDFNNLLTGVTGSLELLQSRIAQGRFKDVDRYVDAAQGAARRAAALTHRLLAFSRRQTLDPKPTDVNRLALGMEELIRRTVGPAIDFEPLVAAADLWPTLIDPGQLENALLNLCINARDAMPDGGKLTIETANRRLDQRTAQERDLLPGEYVSLCVSDTGTGMPPEVMAKAFDPFFTTKPLGQGTGLGLSMIYGFAKQSGGQIRIHSQVGQGTAVCLYLPRHVGEVDVVEPAPELADAPRARDGQTVLVVDDEPTIRMLVTEVLEDLGYRAIEAADGAAGLRILQSDARIDLLVTDVGLPGGINGRQVADGARVARPGLKVLFITGYAETAVLSHGHLDPGMHVLTKPFAMEVIASRIKELIDTSES
ncbi:MAG: PAS domain-containing protein [Janthinobacterium lividum]